MRRLLVPVLLSCTFLIAAPAASQSTVQNLTAIGTDVDPSPGRPATKAETGQAVGIVTAPDGARLPGVTVTVTNVETGKSVVVVTAGNGSYGGSGLLPGTYEVRAELAGFQAQVSPRVTVSAGETEVVDISLPLGTVSETVTVVGALVRDSVETTAIRDSSARDIGEALSRVNGMSLVRKGAIANDVALQGFQSRNLTVLVDGDRIYGACPNGMDPAVFHADFAEVDHLEVGKGPFDVRNQGSLGGLVNVVTRTPGRGVHASPSLSVGSWGYVNPSATASFGTDHLSALAGYSFRTANPYRDGSGTLFTQYANYRTDTVDSTAFDVQTAWGKVLLTPADSHSVQVAYTRQWADHVLYPYLLMDGITDDADRANASYVFAPTGGPVRTVSARAYYTRVRHWMTDALRTSSTNMPREYSMGTQADSSATGGRVDVGIGDVTAGVELFRREWDATTTMAGSKYAPQYAIPFVTLDNAGAFVEYERRLGSRTTIAAGGRLDWAHSEADPARANTDLYFAYKGTRAVSASDEGVSGKMRIVRRLGEGFELSGGVGHTFRVPDPQERYFGLKRMGNDWVGNPGLRPTANTGVQAGVTYRYRRLLASLSVSGNWLTDYVTVHSQQKINTVPGIMNSTARSYENVDARMTSAEFSLSCPLTDRWSAMATASYIRGTKSTDPAKKITSANIAEIPPPYGTVALRYERASFFAEGQGVFSADQTHVDTDLQETPTPGYGLLNLRAGGEFKGLRITLALDNVFDRLYLNYLSFQRDPYRIGVRVREPGRNLYANVAFRF